VAEFCNTLHTEEIFAQRQRAEDFSALRQWYDEPFADTSAFPTFLVSKLARSRVTVALSGDGGDELFGGYPRYYWHRLLHRVSFRHWPAINHRARRALRGLHPRTLRRKFAYMLVAVSSDDLRLHDWLMSGMTAVEKRPYAAALGIPRDYDDLWYYRQFWRRDLPPLTRLQYLDFHTYLPDDILTKVDRASMANSLEVRVPLLARSVIEFAFALPERVRYAGDQAKGLMKRAYAAMLPPAVFTRKKMGFSVPPEQLAAGGAMIQERILRELYPELVCARTDG
jgi:asparagine synthase (glutamine-hydrolysing)